MGRPRTDNETIEAIRDEWAHDPGRSAPQVLNALKKQKHFPSLRVIQREMRKSRQTYQPLPLDPPCVPWSQAWPTNSEEVAFAFQLMLCLRLSSPWPKLLTTRQLSWALRLRHQFEDRDIHLVLYLASRYATLERVAVVLQRPIASESLDGYLLFQAWKSPEHDNQWRRAIRYGIVPPMPPAAVSIEDYALLEPFPSEYQEEMQSDHTGSLRGELTAMKEAYNSGAQDGDYSKFLTLLRERYPLPSDEEIEQWYAWEREIAEDAKTHPQEVQNARASSEPQ